MAEATWEKGNRTNVVLQPNNRGRWKFLVGGLLILIAVGYLVATGMVAGARYYITVDDLMNNPTYVGKSVRVAGVVLGDTIQY